MSIVINIEYGGLYDWDGANLTKVLKLYRDSIEYERFPYAYYRDQYRKPTKKERRKWRKSYYKEES